jgi:hypothetical protein
MKLAEGLEPDAAPALDFRTSPRTIRLLRTHGRSWAYRRPVGAVVAARSSRFGRERGVSSSACSGVLIRRLPVTATSIVCNLVASLSGIWLRRRQISPAPEIPGSTKKFPVRPIQFPVRPKNFPVICLREFADKRLFSRVLFAQTQSLQGQNRKNSQLLRFYGNLGDRCRAADRPS